MANTDQNYFVDVIGFNQTERLLLSSIFGLAARRDPCFQRRDAGSTKPADLYLVDGSDAAAMNEFRAVRARYPAPAVLVGEGAGESGVPQLQRPIQWARLLQSFDDAVQNGAAPGAQKKAAAVSQDAVLVVDDNATVRKFMEAKLAPYGFSADFAETGEQAVGLTGAKE